MKTTIIKSIATVLGGILMAWLFTAEGMGLNVLLFTLVILGMAYWKDPSSFRNPMFLIVAGGTLLSSLLVVWHHSALARTVYIFSFILTIGIFQQRTLRFLWYGLLMGFGSILTAPISIVQDMGSNLKGGWKNLFRWSQLIVLPIAIGLVFYWVYYQAVPAFGNVSDQFGSWFGSFFQWQNPGPFFWLFLLGVILSGSFLWNGVLAPFFRKRDGQFAMKISRKKTAKVFYHSILALKKEYLIAILSISILNGLLLLVNVSNLFALIRRQWASQASELSQNLHTSTELLLISILMAMGILLLFFRRNLNFFPNNHILKVLAYTWLAQNGILAFLTFIQDIQYIITFGMAYYRLGLAFFLLLVFIGLISIYIKIATKRSIYYLFVINAWSVYLCLLFISCFNWDLMITRFNIFHAKNEQIDLSFLINMSDKNTFLLEKHRDHIFEKKEPYYNQDFFEDRLKNRRIHLMNKLEKQSWKSWNRPDYKNSLFIKKISK